MANLRGGTPAGATNVVGRGSAVARVSAIVRARPHLWLVVALVGLAASLLFYAPFLNTGTRQIEYLGVEAFAVAAMAIGLSAVAPANRRAWVLILLGASASLVGDLAWAWISVVEDAPPTPSVADAIYLCEYPLLFAGVATLAWRRLDRTVILDTAIFALGLAAVMWEVLISPNLAGRGDSVLASFLSVTYSATDVAIMSVVAILALSTGLVSQSVRLLAGGLLLLFLADVAYLAGGVAGADLDPFPADFLYPLSMFVWAAAALHPSARVALPPPAGDWLSRRMLRIALLGGALILVPIVAAIDSAGDRSEPLLYLGASIAVAILVVLRLETILARARRSEKRFRMVVEESPAGVGITRGDRLLTVNEAMCAMFGYAADEMLATPLALIVEGGAGRPGDADRATEPFSVEGTGLRADGSHFPVLVQGRAITLDDGPATARFFLDLSELRAAEEEIRSSERRYRELFDANPQPMWVQDEQSGRFIAVNDTAVEAYGWSRTEFLEMAASEMELPIVPTEPAAAPASDGAPVASRHRHRDGSIVDVEVTSHLISWEGRRAILSISLDVTERTRLEEQLRQSQKMEAMGRLAGGVAHDFNNLLTAISGYAELLRAEIPADDERRHDVDEIISASARAAALTNQLLAFGRRGVMELQVVSPNDAIRDTLGLVRRLIGEDILLRMSLDPAVANVRIDVTLLLQVVLNLAVNARDAMPTGGSLSISTSNFELAEADAWLHPGLQPGRKVMLVVADTGTGMDEATLGRLFEPFFTTKPKGQGTGLGLATVYGIVRGFGGTITVESELGRGTTFRILLPAAGGSPTRAVAARAVGAGDAQGSGTVLVVEDEPSLRQLVASVLLRDGYQVLRAGEADEAEAVAEAWSGRIDLLLTDVVMPGRNGAQLAAALTTRRPDMRVLYMSGYTQDAIGHHGVLDEGTAFIAKPFRQEELLRKVAETIAADGGGGPGARPLAG
jgi:two-component system, cell cycle sensor histidine kinase and response regulator CckA